MNKKWRSLALTLGISLCVPLTNLHAAGEPMELDADTVEYNMSDGQAVATGNVLLKNGTSRVAGAKATYNSKTQAAVVEGNVVAIRDSLKITCARIATDGQERMVASGNVEGVDGDKHFSGEQVEYYPNQNKYVLLPTGGTIVSATDSFKANKIEGWLDDEHYVGTGDVHISSQVRDLVAGGDQADYYGKDSGKVVLSGNAWALQDNNTLKSNRLTIYLAGDGQATVK